MKKFILSLLLFFVSINICNATQTFDRNELENYGVNKDIKVNDSNLDNILNTKAVDASLKVYDFADILSDSEEEDLREVALEFVKDTGFDLVIVTDSFYNYDEEDNYAYAQDFYDYNDFGIDLEHYSGVLILRNTYSYKYYGLYSFGEAQLYYNGSRIENILDEMYSDFHNGYYVDGVYTVVDMLNRYYDYGIMGVYKDAYIDHNGFIRFNYSLPIVFCLIGASFLTFIIMLILVKKNKMVRKASKASGYLNRGSIKITESRDEFVNSFTHTQSLSSSSGGSGFSGGSRMGSSGRGFSGGGRRG